MKTVEQREFYETPKCEIFQCRVEAGYAISYNDESGSEAFGKYEDTEL